MLKVDNLGSIQSPGQYFAAKSTWRTKAVSNGDQQKTFCKTCSPFGDRNQLHHQLVKFLHLQFLLQQISRPVSTEIRRKQAHLFLSVDHALSSAFRPCKSSRTKRKRNYFSQTGGKEVLLNDVILIPSPDIINVPRAKLRERIHA